jgi:hypothetical protein
MKGEKHHYINESEVFVRRIQLIFQNINIVNIIFFCTFTFHFVLIAEYVNICKTFDYCEMKRKMIHCKFSIERIPLHFYFLLLMGIFISCEKDFSVISDNSEPFPVVYGLLDIADSVHYIKIYKSYLTDGNAYDLTKDIHKYSYIDSIDVYLIEYNLQGDILRKIPFDTTTSIPKDSGLFGYPVQILYKVYAVLNVDHLYKLVIYNPYTKNIVETNELISLASPPILRIPVNQRYIAIVYGAMEFKFLTGKNTNKYSLQMKYYYSEDLLDNTSRQPKPVIWTIGTVADNSATEGVIKSYTINRGAVFFIRIASEVKQDPNVYRRRTDSIVYEVYAAAKDWDLYQQTTIPPTGVNQERLYYCNLKAYNEETKEEKQVMGFFSSRTKATKSFRDLATPGSRDSLFSGRYTGHLLFTDRY